MCRSLLKFQSYFPALALFGLGTAKVRITSQNPFQSGFVTLMVGGGLASIVAYAVVEHFSGILFPSRCANAAKIITCWSISTWSSLRSLAETSLMFINRPTQFCNLFCQAPISPYLLQSRLANMVKAMFLHLYVDKSLIVEALILFQIFCPTTFSS